MLKVENLSVQFGDNKVVKNVSFVGELGKVTSLIGPNGAGKTTLFDAITGFSKCQTGSVQVAGQEICGLPTYRVSRAGLMRTFQTPRLFEEMSVLENLMVAYPDGGLPNAVPSAIFRIREGKAQKQAIEQAAYWLEFLNLVPKRNNRANDLSGGQRKLVELGRALMTRPQYILLDEPVAGVAPGLVNEIRFRLEDLAKQGLGIIVIEHNMDFVMQISDHIEVLAAGEILASGTPEEIQAHPEVLEAYLGSDIDE